MQRLTDTLLERWDTHNSERIDRALSVMSEESKQVFQLLPALLHYNQPSIPGYIEHAPHGLLQFELEQVQQQLLSGLGVDLKQLPAITKPRILALYSMGSTSTMGQSYSSDIDLWVCISPKMSLETRNKLTEKCTKISQWAKSLGVCVDLFLMDEQRFRQNVSGQLSDEDCGSAQHLILLDEFYRSALRLAGQRLLWRIIPPEMESCYDEYAERLYNSGAIQRDEWMDFGPLYRIPVEEYFGASLWQLYKSIDSPYKSVLKAILLESYTWEYPHPRLLSLESKRRFFALDSKVEHVDSYHLMLEKVTRYLEWTGDDARLDLVRRCFYLKTHEKLSRDQDPQRVEWRYHRLQKLVTQWGWSEKKIKELDDRGIWKVEQVRVMYQDLLDALMTTYRNLIRFADLHKITATISPEDISILSRKLYAEFETLPDKVTLFNTQISSSLEEEHLTFIQTEKNRTNRAGWYVFKAPLEAKALIGQKPLKHHTSLTKVVAWAFFNGLMTENTHINALIHQTKMPISNLHQLTKDLHATFSTERKQPSVKALSSPCEVSQLAIFVNLESDPTTSYSKKEISALPKSLNYKHEHCHIVSSVDVVYRNSWQEIWTMHFEGETAVIDMLKAVLGKMHQNSQAPDLVNVFCYSLHLSELIKEKINDILSECIELRLQPINSLKRRRFKLLKMSSGMFGLFFERRGVSIIKMENTIEFYSNISNNKLQDAPLRMIGREREIISPDVVYSLASEGFVQLFFEDDEDGFNIYVLDEDNKLEVYRQFDGDKEEVIQNMNRFYSKQNQVAKIGDVRQFNLPQYYQIIHIDDCESHVMPYRRN